MTRSALLLIPALLAVGCGEDASSNTAGKTAATACVRSVDALREVGEGNRSFSSAVAVLRDAEPLARRAARRDSKYEPIAEWIVGAQFEIASGEPGANVRRLINECG